MPLCCLLLCSNGFAEEALGALEALGGHRLCRCGYCRGALGALGTLGVFAVVALPKLSKLLKFPNLPIAAPLWSPVLFVLAVLVRHFCRLSLLWSLSLNSLNSLNSLISLSRRKKEKATDEWLLRILSRNRDLNPGPLHYE